MSACTQNDQKVVRTTTVLFEVQLMGILVVQHNHRGLYESKLTVMYRSHRGKSTNIVKR